MEDRIAALDDAEALRLVQTIGAAFARAEDYETHLPPDLQATLGAAFDAASAGGTVSEGDLARAALQLYAEDPEHRAALTAMLDHPAPQSFDLGATLAVTAAVLVILQTHVRFYRDKDGKWTLKVEKKPTSDALLKPLVQKLLGFVSGGS